MCKIYLRCFKYQNTPAVAAVAAGVAVPPIAAGSFTPREHPGYNQGFATRKRFLFSTTPLQCFVFHIPLKLIFGFASDYKKVIYGMKHTLTLTRGDDMDALNRNGATNGKVQVTNISWNKKQVKPSPEYHAGIMSIIAQKISLPLFFQAKISEQITLTQTLNQTWRISVTGGVEKPR